MNQAHALNLKGDDGRPVSGRQFAAAYDVLDLIHMHSGDGSHGNVGRPRPVQYCGDGRSQRTMPRYVIRFDESRRGRIAPAVVTSRVHEQQRDIERRNQQRCVLTLEG